MNYCSIYEMWWKNKIFDIASHESLRENIIFSAVLEQILDVPIMLATCNLAFRSSKENIGDSNKGNFLSVIKLLAKYDPI